MNDVTAATGAGVTATLNYLAPGSARNRLYVAPGAHMTTTQYAPTAVRVADGRPHRGDFGLDSSGFTLLDHRSALAGFADADEIDRVYVPEATDLVRRVTGADQVVSIGWVIRRAADDKKGAQPPATDVHVDMHPGRAHSRLAAMPESGAYSRAVMTSLWRAFSPPPQDWPLAILDYRSVDDTEGEPNLLLFVDEIPAPDEVPDVIEGADSQPAGSIFAYRPGHRWWYFPDMQADEALLFKLHDSDHSVAWRAPHTAFHDAGNLAAHPRESIEIRTVAFFH
jgi:hypothetical protein